MADERDVVRVVNDEPSAEKVIQATIDGQRKLAEVEIARGDTSVECCACKGQDHKLKSFDGHHYTVGYNYKN